MRKLAILWLLILTAACSSKTITVKKDGKGDYTTIQAGISSAVDGDIVIISDGIYRGDGNRDIDFLGKAITVISENGPENCIIDCEGAEADPHRGFIFQSGEASDSVLSGVTVTGGYASNDMNGGAICCIGSNPVIVDCVLTGNITTGLGGAISCYKSKALISRCKVINNTAQLSAGGIHCCQGEVKITNCLVAENAVYGDCGTGGGIYGIGMEIDSCTVTRNSTPGCYQPEAGGGGISGGMMTVTNSIIWGNRSDDMSQVSVLRGYEDTVEVSYSDIEGGFEGVGNIDADPGFTGGDYHLSPGSACINAGDPDYDGGLDQTDIDGQARVIAGRVDMGVDELKNLQMRDRFNLTQDASVAGQLTPLEKKIAYGSPSIVILETEDLTQDSVTGTVELKCNYDDTATWSIEHDCGWLELDYTSGTYSEEMPAEIVLTAKSEGLSEGVYHCVLSLYDSNQLFRACTIDVYFNVADSCYPKDYSSYDDWVEMGRPDCWCGQPFGSGYQCDGDAGGGQETCLKYRVYVEDIALVVENWKKKIGDPGFNPCADIDHKPETFFKFRVYTHDIAKIVANWKAKDNSLTGDCPRPD